MIYRRNIKMAELEVLKSAPSEHSQELSKELEGQERIIRELKTENSSLKDKFLHVNQKYDFKL